MRWGRPRRVVRCLWKTARRKRRMVREPRPREVVLCADQVDVHLNPRIGPDWMLPKQQRLVVTPGQNKERYNAGA